MNPEESEHRHKVWVRGSLADPCSVVEVLELPFAYEGPGWGRRVARSEAVRLIREAVSEGGPSLRRVRLCPCRDSGLEKDARERWNEEMKEAVARVSPRLERALGGVE